MGGSKIVKMFICFFFFFFLIERCWRCEGCLEQEKFALLQLKHFFNEPHILTNLVDDEDDKNYLDCCRWDRVECNITTGRVTALYLDGARKIWESTEKWYMNASLFIPFEQLEFLDLIYNNIAGFVENEGLERLSMLSNLKFLDLSDNYFNNSILPTLGYLSSLRSLLLSNNSLKGIIDVKEMDCLNNLERLDMSYNEINEFVAPKGLSRLEYLSLSNNKLNNGVVSSLTALSSVRVLYLNENRFKGSFYIQELDSLNNLEVLDMSNNEIDNLVVPKGYRILRKLKALHLDGVVIRDGSKLLQSIGSFPSLENLFLRFNNFTETVTINEEFHNVTTLEELMLDGSTLHISLLQSIAAFTSLKKLSMQSCGLSGDLHDQGLCELEHLQELYIQDSDLRGSLPGCLTNLTSLLVLDVSSNQLTGNIFSSPLMHLTSIQELRLSNNQFQIPISLEPFFNHSKLKYFDGGSNDIYVETESHYSLAPKFQLTSISLSGYGNGGTFPNFLYYQQDLENVDLSHVNLTGEFPNWLLGNNTKLETLFLVNNCLSGPLHMPIHPHMQLVTIDVSNNNFRGNIPVEIGVYLPRLQNLNFSMNDFEGSIPSTFGDMKSLFSLDLSNNKLTGEIPEQLSMGCFNLRYFVLSNNSLQGQLFSKSFNLTNLWRLQLDGNHFIGKIPESLSNCSFLGGLYFSDNNLSGKIPKWLGNVSFLEDIIMPNNHLEGPIPTELCHLDFLHILDLSDNNISGSLPSCFSLSSIKQVHLSKNMLQGPLTDGTFFNSSSLVTIDLSYNRLNGIIPYWIERLTQLNYLILANNNLEGEMPVHLCLLKQLRLIDLSHNSLSGHIPPCLDNTSLHGGYYDAPAPTYNHPSSNPVDTGNSIRKEETIAFTTKERTYYYKGKPLNSMYGIDLSCNKLTGGIPSQIGELTKIHALNFSHNNLTGTIPTTFSDLKQVESLDLSYNFLNGKIPPQLVELNSLAVFSVAYNNLSGKIPEWTAQFATFNESSYMGNHFLCGLPLPKSCNENATSSPVVTPEASTSEGEDDSLIDMNSFYIAFTASYAVVVLGIAGALYVNLYWRRRWFNIVETWMTSSYDFVVNNLYSY